MIILVQLKSLPSSFTVVTCMTVYRVSVNILLYVKSYCCELFAVTACAYVRLVYMYLVLLLNERKEAKVEILDDMSKYGVVKLPMA